MWHLYDIKCRNKSLILIDIDNEKVDYFINDEYLFTINIKTNNLYLVLIYKIYFILN